MGFRTVVVLYNDHCSEWEKDPELGRKIATGMNYTHESDQWNSPSNLHYGQVVECAHADQQTAAILDGYQFYPLAYSCWRSGEVQEDRNVRLLKELANKLGYTVSKKRGT